MLKRFLQNMLSSFVGSWLALMLFGVVCVIIVVGAIGKLAISSASSAVSESVKSRSVLLLKLDGEIDEVEQVGKPVFTDLARGKFDAPAALNVIIQGLREGAKNDDIAMLYIECGSLAASPATLNAIRDEVVAFRKSGKKVIAYGDQLGMGSYYVASAADCVYMNPSGELSLNGLGGTSLYMKSLFDKLGVQFQVVKVGTFKSAVEPYIMENMSEPARAQLDTLYGNMWSYIKKEIADSRKGLTPSMIDSLVSVRHISFAPAQASVDAGLIDSLIYGREINSRIAAIVGKDKDKLNFVTPSTLVAQTQWGNGYSSRNQIAVLYATGEIVDGGDKGINYEKLVPQIVKLAEDDNVKGLVLRVNSPGGSAFGSDQIGEALDYFRSTGKPLSVSMGDYAASGGYWISCGADRIFADPLTITGSIGIFGLIPNARGLLDKVGINPQMVNTNPSAAFPNAFRPMDESQLAVMQSYVERGYAQFVGRVAKGRKMSEAQVRRIAEGRVWDASTAKRIGLVDELAGLQAAIDWTADKAGVSTKYDVALYPPAEPSIWSLLQMSAGNNAMMQMLFDDDKFETMARDYVERLVGTGRLQARMPAMKVGFAS